MKPYSSLTKSIFVKGVFYLDNVTNSVNINKNGVPMQWQVTPYFVYIAQVLVIEKEFALILLLINRKENYDSA